MEGTGERVPEDPVRGLSGTPAYVSGVEGPERIAPPRGPPQGDSPILPGSIRPPRLRPAHGARPATRHGRSVPFSPYATRGGTGHPDGARRAPDEVRQGGHRPPGWRMGQTEADPGPRPSDRLRWHPLGRLRLTPPWARHIIRRTTTRRALSGARRVCVPSGVVTDRPRGRMERIPNSPDEADLSAQEAPPRQGARLPRPDEVGRRPADPGRTPGSGSKAADGLTVGRGSTTPRLVMLSRPQDFAAFQGGGTTRSHPLLTARVQADRSRDDPFRTVDRPSPRRSSSSQSCPSQAPRGAQGDGALVPARLGRPHHRPAIDRHGRPRRGGRSVAPNPRQGRCARRFRGLKRVGIGLIKVYRFVFAWLPPELSIRADLLALHRAGDPEVRPAQGKLDGSAADRPLSSLEPRWL